MSHSSADRFDLASTVHNSLLEIAACLQIGMLPELHEQVAQQITDRGVDYAALMGLLLNYQEAGNSPAPRATQERSRRDCFNQIAALLGGEPHAQTFIDVIAFDQLVGRYADTLSAELVAPGNVQTMAKRNVMRRYLLQQLEKVSGADGGLVKAALWNFDKAIEYIAHNRPYNHSDSVEDLIRTDWKERARENNEQSAAYQRIDDAYETLVRGLMQGRLGIRAKRIEQACAERDIMPDELAYAAKGYYIYPDEPLKRDNKAVVSKQLERNTTVAANIAHMLGSDTLAEDYFSLLEVRQMAAKTACECVMIPPPLNARADRSVPENLLAHTLKSAGRLTGFEAISVARRFISDVDKVIAGKDLDRGGPSR